MRVKYEFRTYDLGYAGGGHLIGSINLPYHHLSIVLRRINFKIHEQPKKFSVEEE